MIEPTVGLLDPWRDAQLIAERLAQPGAELLAVLGAESWCAKCRSLRPAFEQLAAGLPSHVLPLWLDLEDHADLLAGFVPPDLPLLLRWQAGCCVQAAVLEHIELAAVQPLQRVRLQALPVDGEQLTDPHDGTTLWLPPLWQTLTSGGWGEA